MTGLMVRIGADRSAGGGYWNGPVDSNTGRFVYVPIPEQQAQHPGLKTLYEALAPDLKAFGRPLPEYLRLQPMHLDPDFVHLTYGDRGGKAKQLETHLTAGDFIAFYAGLEDVHGARELVYAIVGFFVVDALVPAASVSSRERPNNAHTRCGLPPRPSDRIIIARPGVSGRLSHCLPIGRYRDRAYRVRPDLLKTWGGLSIKDGYLQRSARLPRFLHPDSFLRWFEQQQPRLLRVNNPVSTH